MQKKTLQRQRRNTTSGKMLLIAMEIYMHMMVAVKTINRIRVVGRWDANTRWPSNLAFRPKHRGAELRNGTKQLFCTWRLKNE